MTNKVDITEVITKYIDDAKSLIEAATHEMNDDGLVWDTMDIRIKLTSLTCALNAFKKWAFLDKHND